MRPLHHPILALSLFAMSVFSFAENWPFTAIRLANGNTVVNLTHGNKTVEFDAKGKIVWRVDNSHVVGRFDDPCGGQRLPNGNTVISSYHQENRAKVAFSR
tara:strand:+ start:157 stop:459 length:303 start_codon:yes stop_codon:yes gene_type:complete